MNIFKFEPDTEIEVVAQVLRTKEQLDFASKLKENFLVISFECGECIYIVSSNDLSSNYTLSELELLLRDAYRYGVFKGLDTLQPATSIVEDWKKRDLE